MQPVPAADARERSVDRQDPVCREDFSRDKYLLTFQGAQPVYAKREPKEGQTQPKVFKVGIYVMSPEGRFCGRRETPERQRTFHHSSLLAGGAVGAAGQMSLKSDGTLWIDLESGHYRPTTQHMVNAPDVEALLVRYLASRDGNMGEEDRAAEVERLRNIAVGLAF